MYQFTRCAILLVTLIPFSVFAQVGIGTSSPDASAVFEAASTQKGILVPRMSTSDRDAISSPANGLLIYNNSVNAFEFYNGSGWMTIRSGSITNSDIATNAGIAHSKLNLSNSVTNSDISSSASIAYSKLALSGSLTDSDLASNAGISYGKLSITGSLMNSDVASNADIAYSKLDLSNSVTNSDVSSSAAIDYSKLALSGSITNSDVSSSAGITYEKLSLTGSLLNSDVASNAGIAYGKLNLTSSLKNSDISSNAAIAFNKLSIGAADIRGLTPYSAGTGLTLTNGTFGINNSVVTSTYASSVEIGQSLSAGGAGHSSAILAATSTTKGFLLPRMTATQRAAISTPATGLQVYQTDGAKGVYAYDGSNWMLNSEWYSNSATSPSVFALSKPGNLNSTGASANIGIGSGTLAGITTGDNNVALGVNALNDVVTSGNSTAVGFGSLSNSTGTGNTAIGFTSGTTNLSGSNNTFIGNQANASLTDLVNATAIGSGAEVSADNTIQLGNNSVINVNTAGGITAGGAVGIGTTSPNPNAALDITSTTQGFLPPRMTNSQINSIYNPVEGLMVYNSTYGHLEVFQKTYGLANKIIDQIPNPLGSYSITGGHGAWQEFTPTVSGLLDSIVLFQSNPLPNPTTTFKYEMRIFSGVTSASGYTLYGGTLLTSANTFLPANNLDARRAYHFQSPIYLTSGVKYWFQITGYCNPCNTDTGFNSTDTYPGNDGFIGGSTKDLFFQVYMREDTGLNWKSL